MPDCNSASGTRGLPPLRSQLALETTEEVQGYLLAVKEALLMMRPVPAGAVAKVQSAIEANALAADYAEEVLILDQMDAQRRRFGPIADYNDKLRPRILALLRRRANERVLPTSISKTRMTALVGGKR